jgi:hypothetical protein
MFKNDLYDMQLVDFDSSYQVFSQFFRIILGIICLVFLGWENCQYSKMTQEQLEDFYLFIYFWVLLAGAFREIVKKTFIDSTLWVFVKF